MKDEIGDVLKSLRQRLERLYGVRLKGLYLFGSFARDDADEESDIDVLIVLDRVSNYSAEIADTSGIVSDLSLEFRQSISCVFASEEQWRNENTMFFLNVRKEAVSA